VIITLPATEKKNLATLLVSVDYLAAE